MQRKYCPNILFHTSRYPIKNYSYHISLKKNKKNLQNNFNRSFFHQRFQ